MSIPFPITRIDAEKREVEGVVAFEDVDEHGTIFSYEASKEAFQAWLEHGGVVREMFDVRHPVGKVVNIVFDDEAKQATVHVKVSKGAQDTLAKILSGSLSLFGIAFTSPTWSKVEREGKEYPYLVKYRLASLSLISPPKCADSEPGQ
jgi:hypothetical protein